MGTIDKNSDVRQDFLDHGAVVTLVRGKRPTDAVEKPRPIKTVSPEKCFFCPGNEHLTPPEIDRIERNNKWEIRCFPNKFPAFSRDYKLAYGRHEVIVETPDHQKTLSDLSLENISNYLLMVKKRMQSAQSDRKLKYTCVFKNEGQAAGASLEHSHTQLTSMTFVPKFVLKIMKNARKFETMSQKSKKSLVFQNRGFIALCPFVSRFPYETWILPKMKAKSIVDLNEDDIFLFSEALKSVVLAIDHATGFSPYNLSFHNAPHKAKKFPFHLQILPRISTWAGFEFSTEMVMTSYLPEESASLLSSLISRHKA